MRVEQCHWLGRGGGGMEGGWVFFQASVERNSLKCLHSQNNSIPQVMALG